MIKEKGQYLLAFGVVGSMLLVTGFPVFVIFFFGIFAYFLFRIFSSGSKNETREIFEFYLTANEILRDDGRRWFGFEVKDAVARGEAIVNRMANAPPLVYFTLGALYNKAGDHQLAINSLAKVIESESGREASYVFASPELRSYVKVLRKIEREPSEAPLTSAAIRSLERSRRLRGRALLDESRAAYVASSSPQTRTNQLTQNGHQGVRELDGPTPNGGEPVIVEAAVEGESIPEPQPLIDSGVRAGRDVSRTNKKDRFADRKPISEVLHDIYDRNIQ